LKYKKYFSKEKKMKKKMLTLLVVLLIGSFALYTGCPGDDFKEPVAKKYDIAVAIAAGSTGSGTFEINGSAQTGSVEYAEGSTITVKIIPAGGSQLNSFTVAPDGVYTGSMAVETEGTQISFTMPSKAVTITAVFGIQVIPTYSIVFDDDYEGGTLKIEVDGSEIESGDRFVVGKKVTLIAENIYGYTFEGFSFHKTDDSEVTIAVTSNIFDMPAFDIVVTALFERIPSNSREIIWLVIPDQLDKEDVFEGEGFITTGTINEAVEFTVNDDFPGFDLDEVTWKAGESGTPSTLTGPDYSFIIPNTVPEGTAIYVTATFTMEVYAINVVQSPDCNFTVTGGIDSVSAQPLMTITLTPNIINDFTLEKFVVYKTGDQSPVDMLTYNTFKMPAEDVTVTAVFEKGIIFKWDSNNAVTKGLTGGLVNRESYMVYEDVYMGVKDSPNKAFGAALDGHPKMQVASDGSLRMGGTSAGGGILIIGSDHKGQRYSPIWYNAYNTANNVNNIGLGTIDLSEGTFRITIDYNDDFVQNDTAKDLLQLMICNNTETAANSLLGSTSYFARFRTFNDIKTANNTAGSLTLGDYIYATRPGSLSVTFTPAHRFADSTERVITALGPGFFGIYVPYSSTANENYLSIKSIKIEKLDRAGEVYNIDTTGVTNGTVVLDKTSAQERGIVTYRVFPKPGYKLDSSGFIIKDSEGTDVAIHFPPESPTFQGFWWFSMPASNATITANFVPDPNIVFDWNYIDNPVSNVGQLSAGLPVYGRNPQNLEEEKTFYLGSFGGFEGDVDGRFKNGAIRIGGTSNGNSVLIIGSGTGTATPNPRATSTTPSLFVPGDLDLSNGEYLLTFNYSSYFDPVDPAMIHLIMLHINNNRPFNSESVLGGDSRIHNSQAGNFTNNTSFNSVLGRWAYRINPRARFVDTATPKPENIPYLEEAFLELWVQGAAAPGKYITITRVTLEKLP